jgi:hypothetical protein
LGTFFIELCARAQNWTTPVVHLDDNCSQTFKTPPGRRWFE